MLYPVDAHGHHNDAQYWPQEPMWLVAAWRLNRAAARFFDLKMNELLSLPFEDPIRASLEHVGLAADAESGDFMKWCFYTDIAESLEKIIELKEKRL